jgi:hypothetical protein
MAKFLKKLWVIFMAVSLVAYVAFMAGGFAYQIWMCFVPWPGFSAWFWGAVNFWAPVALLILFVLSIKPIADAAQNVYEGFCKRVGRSPPHP